MGGKDILCRGPEAAKVLKVYWGVPMFLSRRKPSQGCAETLAEASLQTEGSAERRSQTPKGFAKI